MKKKNKTKKQDAVVLRKDDEFMEEFRQDLLDKLGDTEFTRIVLKHFWSGKRSPDAVREASLEHDKYLLHESHKGFKEITQS